MSSGIRSCRSLRRWETEVVKLLHAGRLPEPPGQGRGHRASPCRNDREHRLRKAAAGEECAPGGEESKWPYAADGFDRLRVLLELVNLLLDHGANVEAHDTRGFTALMAASGGGQLDMAKLLIDTAPTVNAKSDDGTTALQLAIDNKHPDVEALLRSERRA